MPEETEDVKPFIVNDRQIQIVQMAADGYIFKEIAQKLGIGKKTVETHLYVMYKAIGLKTIQHAVAHFMRHNLIK